MVVDTETNDMHHTSLEPTRSKVIARAFVRELCEKHDIDDAEFFIDREESLQYAYQRHGLTFRYEKHGDRKCRTIQ